MNRNAMVGLVLVFAAAALAWGCASVRCGLAEGLFGKAVWYVPYVALVGGIRRLFRARG